MQKGMPIYLSTKEVMDHSTVLTTMRHSHSTTKKPERCKELVMPKASLAPEPIYGGFAKSKPNKAKKKVVKSKPGKRMRKVRVK